MTPIHKNEIMKIEDDTQWIGVHFIKCTIVTPVGPKRVYINRCTFDDCTFLYDGMEVDPLEWQALITRKPLR